MERNQVVLVDENDTSIGTMDKLEAHQKGILHRAFSVFVFNGNNELLLQQRSLKKYHSPLLWANTCCSHPQLSENINQSAVNRLNEEMGFSCQITKVFDFIYKADVGQGLIEHEFDHVFKGFYNENPNPNPDEVASFCWMSLEEVKKDIILFPDKYTEWFKIIFEKYLSYFSEL